MAKRNTPISITTKLSEADVLRQRLEAGDEVEVVRPFAGG